jgi:hypothetical protein
MSEVNNLFGAIVDAYVTAQRARIQWSNRMSAYTRGTDQPESPELLSARSYTEAFQAIENRAREEFGSYLDSHPAWPWLNAQKGISVTLAAKLVSRIDIHRTPRVSNLWSLAGFSVIDGHAPRLEKGKKRTWDGRLKTTCWLCGRSFLMCGSPYRDRYDQAKAKFASAHPDWSLGHIHNAAMGKMIKFFLFDFWKAWREAEGLPVTQPYAIAILGHAI